MSLTNEKTTEDIAHGIRKRVFLHTMRSVLPRDQQTIVFAATRHHVEYVHHPLSNPPADGDSVLLGFVGNHNINHRWSRRSHLR